MKKLIYTTLVLFLAACEPSEYRGIPQNLWDDVACKRSGEDGPLMCVAGGKAYLCIQHGRTAQCAPMSSTQTVFPEAR